jgi:hypothetical protein
MFLNMINLLHFNFGAFVFVFDVALLGYLKRGIWRISVNKGPNIYSYAVAYFSRIANRSLKKPVTFKNDNFYNPCRTVFTSI